MSKPKVFEKPIGFKDYLPGAVKKLRSIENRVLACMESWGYEQIITPTIEFYDTVGAASATNDAKLFKLLNNRGTTLVLRSDMTAPIARVVSSLLKDSEFPVRLSYHANVFRSIEEEAGRDAEFFQTGLELVGDSSAEADAEVVALAIASLKAAGVSTFKIAIGHVGFLNGLLEDALGGREEEQLALKESLLKRDYVGFREYLQHLKLEDYSQQQLLDLLRLRGGEDVCERALTVSSNPMARKAVEHLCEIWSVLKAYDVCEHVLIDLSMIGDFSYYTGMTFEGYASDLGFPVVSGGRYDNLLAQFGRPAPATGFALKTTRVLELLELDDEQQAHKALIVYNNQGRMQAIQTAQLLRAQGEHVVTERVEDINSLQELQKWSNEQNVFTYKGNLYEKIVVCLGEKQGG